DSWGLKRSEPKQSAKLPAQTTSKRISSTQVNPPADPRRGASARDVPTPPVNLVRPLTMSKCPSTDLRCNGERPVASTIADGKSLHSTSSWFIGAVFRKLGGGGGGGGTHF